MRTTAIDAYQPNLSPGQLDTALSSIVQTQRRCEWLLCRYLADMAEDRAFQKVGWFADVFHYTQERFGLSMKVTRERVRIRRALRSLPRIEKAFVDGALSYSRVRELTRVATAEDEHDWLRQARLLPMRELEQRVAGRVCGAFVADGPAQERWRSAETVDVTLHLPADSWGLLRRAIQAARHESEASLTDAQALEAVANHALAALCQPDATSAADPRKAVVLCQCRECDKTELETGAGAVPLLPAQAERLSAGAKVVDLMTEGIEEATTEGTMPAAVRRAVLARDRGCCRLCGRSKYVDVHHLQPRSQGGAHSRANCAVLCSACHRAVHDGKVQVQGSAEGELRWLDAKGRPYRRPNAPIGACSGATWTTAVAGPIDAPIGGSTQALPQEPTTPKRFEGSQKAQELLEVMRSRDRWHPDHLVKPTGLDFRSVTCALFELTMAHAVGEGPPGYYWAAC